MLRHGGGSPLAIREARNFRCSVCEETAPPKTRRPISEPRDYQPLAIVGADVKTLPSWEKGPRGEPLHVNVLNLVCLGPRYQQAIIMPDESASSWRSRYLKAWVRPFGVPDGLWVDKAGATLSDEFLEAMAADRTLIRYVGGEAHWQTDARRDMDKSWKQV